MKFQRSGRLALLSVLLIAWGCVEEESGAEVAAEPDGAAHPEPPGLRAVAAETAYGWSGPGGRPFEVALRTPGDASHLHGQMGTKTFPLPLRTSELTLTQYPCTSCHEGAVGAGGPRGDAHRNIQPVHPAQTGAACATCHVSGAVERLALQSGETASLDQPYRLCAQCHFSVVDAWAAGAHGKRLQGWGGRRVVMNCTDCHDPHRPGLEWRIPFPGPRIPRSPGGAP